MRDLNILIITGLSGSGKSTALNALEDEGYFCVDNMPVMLLPKFLELRRTGPSEVQRLAFGMDLREKSFINQYQEIFEGLKEAGYHLDIFFLEASEETLLKRYSETRRQHPISKGSGLLQSIRSEKEQLKPLRDTADKIIDTTQYSVHQLKEQILRYAFKGVKTERMRIGIVSFGFKYGIPLETDLLMDVRFIPNPYFVPELKELDGKDEKVQRFVKKWPETRYFLDRFLDLLDFLLPRYEKEGKSYLTIAVGCTGGRHRSVTIAQEIFDHLKPNNKNLSLTHRDIEFQ